MATSRDKTQPCQSLVCQGKRGKATHFNDENQCVILISKPKYEETGEHAIEVLKSLRSQILKKVCKRYFWISGPRKIYVHIPFGKEVLTEECALAKQGRSRYWGWSMAASARRAVKEIPGNEDQRTSAFTSCKTLWSAISAVYRKS